MANISSSSSSSSGGIGFVGLLTILFIALKLTGYIDWSWWWVLAPIWISFAVVIAILAGAFAIIITKELRDDRKRLERRKNINIR